MKQAKFLFLLIVVLAFASCGSDEPRYADPEAHEKTVQLNELYGPLMVGTWHYENISDTQCYFERLTFQADGTLTGMRKWQTRKPVTITDNGHGIPPAIAKNLFTPFFSTKPQGQGLGLLLIRDILTSHHCTFNLLTDPEDHLTRFTIQFPHK